MYNPEPVNNNAHSNEEYRRPVYNSELIQLRLDCRELHEEIKNFLRGYEIVPRTVNGDTVNEVIKHSEPLVNPQGVSGIMSYIKCIINPQVVQGNFFADKYGVSDSYNNYISCIEDHIADLIHINAYEWEICDKNLMWIRRVLADMIYAFMTRLINNEERKSYGETLRSIESSSTNSRGNRFSFFKK